MTKNSDDLESLLLLLGVLLGLTSLSLLLPLSYPAFLVWIKYLLVFCCGSGVVFMAMLTLEVWQQRLLQQRQQQPKEQPDPLAPSSMPAPHSPDLNQ